MTLMLNWEFCNEAEKHRCVSPFTSGSIKPSSAVLAQLHGTPGSRAVFVNSLKAGRWDGGGAQMEYVGVLYSEQRAGRESSVSELYAWISNALTHSLTVDLSPLQHV